MPPPQILQHLHGHLPDTQAQRAVELLQRDLTHSSDWIVLNVTIEVLAEWARCNPALAGWLKPELTRLSRDPHKSVFKRPSKRASPS